MIDSVNYNPIFFVLNVKDDPVRKVDEMPNLKENSSWEATSGQMA